MLLEEHLSAGAQRFARPVGAYGGRPTHPARPPRDGSQPARAPAYTARVLRPDDATALDEAYRLRQAVFARELSWVAGGRNGRERDRCDATARHFAVYARTSSIRQRAPLVAYARVLVAGDSFMLQREFAALLTGYPFAPDHRRAFEVSRFVVHPDYRGHLGLDRRSAVEHLGRAIAGWACAAGRTEWLSVCELRHVRALRLRGLPFTRFGRVVEYQPGVPVCATRLDLAQATTRLRERRPVDYTWYAEEASL